jgi:hypothetical protein
MTSGVMIAPLVNEIDEEIFAAATKEIEYSLKKAPGT